jgi:hypothetical protein
LHIVASATASDPAFAIQPKSDSGKYSDLRDKISFWLALTRDHPSCHVFQPFVTPSGRCRAADGAEDGVGVPATA